MNTLALPLLLILALLWPMLPGSAIADETFVDPDNPSLEVMAGQMLMVGFRGLDAPEGSPVARAITELHLGGVILFDYDVALKKPGRNIASPEQLAELTAQLRTPAQIPLFLAVDQEGGKVQRLKASAGFHETPSAADLGREGTEAAHAAGEEIGRQLAGYGLNLDFAPVLDVDVNPDSPAIGALGRSFSPDPDQAAELGLAFLDGLRAQGVFSCVKHFPGHGSASTDSHTGLPDITNTWTEQELAPFARIIQAQATDMVMTAHLFNARLDPEHPATLSRNVVQGLLRDELGFAGVVVTDDLGMGAIAERYGLDQAIQLAVEAGCDILLFGNNLTYDPDLAFKAHAALVGLVRDGTIPLERIRLSYGRIMALKARLAG